MNETKTIHWDKRTDGIVVLTLDDPGASANTMNDDFHESLRATMDRLEAECDSIAGVVLTSAKPTFFAGGNLHDLIAATPADTERFAHFCNALKHELRRLETFRRPVVATIGGAALGGGLELALAAHHRIAVDAKNVVVGLPEVNLGLLPGCGGIVRAVRLLGVRRALGDVLLSGTRFGAIAAREIGLIDEVVASPDDLLSAAATWIQANPGGCQPWDRAGYRIPGGTPSHGELAQQLPTLSAGLLRQHRGAPAPAPRAILAGAVEGAQVDFETAALIETRYFIPLVTGPIAKNMIQSTFFDLQAIRSGASRPAEFPKSVTRKVGVIGAGMMGAAIAYVFAKAGVEVVLMDTDIDSARRGKAYSERLERKARERGRATEAAASVVLDRIVPTADPEDFAGVDFVIEAVYESVGVKHGVFQQIQDIVRSDAVLGSNTSTLPITTLAEGVQRQEDFIGVHFFSPVDKMPLVEIITGKNTSARTLAKVFDYTRQIGKTPIVVRDSRGFFTSRVIMTFLDEAAAAVGEGIDPAIIEQAGSQAGYPAPPLQLMDELTLTLPRTIRQEKRAAVEQEGGTWLTHGSDLVADRMIDEFGRKGRSTGGGFYDYDDSGKRVGLWPGLRSAFDSSSTTVPFEDLMDRMLFAEALESVRCLDEGVLTSVSDANVGSLLGIGYPAWTGGVIQFINGYRGGLPGFVERAHYLAQRYGAHFTPPRSMERKAALGESLR